MSLTCSCDTPDNDTESTGDSDLPRISDQRSACAGKRAVGGSTTIEFVDPEGDHEVDAVPIRLVLASAGRGVPVEVYGLEGATNGDEVDNGAT